MIAVRAKIEDGKIVWPAGFDPPAAGEVIIVFDADDWNSSDQAYLSAAEKALAKVWNNPDDDIFNEM